jgi:NADPH-dependent 2,4-dienoyl-CoA reductase/sulfur reductase-like enzyme/rhodanese-related sulfurtransferase
VLSPGSEPIRPPIPGIADPRILTLRNMGDMDAILGRMDGAKSALVIGGGYIGLEMAEAFRQRGLKVILVEKLNQVMSVADPDMVAPLHDELTRNGVDLRLGTSVEGFEPGKEALVALLSDGTQVACDLALLAIGVRPETTLLRSAGLATGTTGGILVDEQMCTSDPHIWAVGDAVEVKDAVLGGPVLIPLAGPANRQGRIAADNILGRPSTYKGTQGTAICKVFDLAFAMTGHTEKGLTRRGVSFRKIFVHPADHATYYPCAHPMTLKLLFAPEDGRILGAQAVGVSGVDKRIDVLATAMRGGLTVYDLEDSELCYAPPFGSAKDPVNMAGFVASNVLRGDVALWEPEEIATLGSCQVLMDVRSLQEFQNGTIPGAVLAPVDELRDRLDDLDKEKEYLVFCQVGLRGYVASRILSQRGFLVRNLSGGYKRFQMWKGAGAAPLACETLLKEEGSLPTRS